MQDPELGLNPHLRPRIVEPTSYTRGSRIVESHLSCDSFRNLSERLADIGWVIVERPLDWKEEGSWVLIHVNDWDASVDCEPPALGGQGGRALGLPPKVARHVYRHTNFERPDPGSNEDNPGGLFPVAFRQEFNAAHPPPYREYLALGETTLAVLEEMIPPIVSPGERVDFEALTAAAVACTA